MDTTEYDYLFKYIMVGDTIYTSSFILLLNRLSLLGVGKSSLLGMFVDNKYRQDSLPTLGVEFASRRVEVFDKIVKLQIWDTAGQQAFRTITRAYYKNTIGVLLVFDINVRKTFESLVSWLTQIREHSNPDVHIVVVANKIDLEASEVTEEDLKSLELPYYYTSARTGENINDPFMDMSQEILKKAQSGMIDISDPVKSKQLIDYVQLTVQKSGVRKGMLKAGTVANPDRSTIRLVDHKKEKGKQGKGNCSC